jgi:hypothetical protein
MIEVLRESTLLHLKQIQLEFLVHIAATHFRKSSDSALTGLSSNLFESEVIQWELASIPNFLSISCDSFLRISCSSDNADRASSINH